MITQHNTDLFTEKLQDGEDYNGNMPNRYVPDLPAGCSLFAVNPNAATWYYVNHAGTWQGMPSPIDASLSSDVRKKAQELLDTLERGGEWEDARCFYYQGRAASELQHPMRELREALGRVASSDMEEAQAAYDLALSLAQVQP